MKTLAPFLLLLMVAGCSGVARESCADLGVKDVPRRAEKPRPDYDAQTTKLYESYPDWGANRMAKDKDGKDVLVKAKSIRGTHPRTVEDDYYFFYEDTGKVGQHPSAGDPGRHSYGRDYPYYYPRRFFYRGFGYHPWYWGGCW